MAGWSFVWGDREAAGPRGKWHGSRLVMSATDAGAASAVATPLQVSAQESAIHLRRGSFHVAICQTDWQSSPKPGPLWQPAWFPP